MSARHSFLNNNASRAGHHFGKLALKYPAIRP
jgi:hypothetical protein